MFNLAECINSATSMTKNTHDMNAQKKKEQLLRYAKKNGYLKANYSDLFSLVHNFVNDIREEISEKDCEQMTNMQWKVMLVEYTDNGMSDKVLEVAQYFGR